MGVVSHESYICLIPDSQRKRRPDPVTLCALCGPPRSLCFAFCQRRWCAYDFTLCKKNRADPAPYDIMRCGGNGMANSLENAVARTRALAGLVKARGLDDRQLLRQFA